MKHFILSIAHNKRQQLSNTTYEVRAEISSLEALAKAVQFDHISGQFKDNKRADDNFISADCVMMDCDNDHSNNPKDWLTPEKLSIRLEDVEFATVYSKSHEKVKGNFSARTRFHVYFPLSATVNKSSRIRELKAKICMLIPEFDKAAKDVSRVFLGIENPVCRFFEGSLCVDEFIDKANLRENPSSEIIHEGKRNKEMFDRACQILRDYPDEVFQAHIVFEEESLRCQPPLPKKELNNIWKSALKHVKKSPVKKSPEKRKILTLANLEQTLQALNISVRFNVITKQFEFSDLPPDNEYVPQAYYRMSAYERKKANAELLPLFLTAYLKNEGYKFSDNFLSSTIEALANANKYNPFREMIEKTQWDRVNRLDDLYYILGISLNTYHCNFLCKWLHQAIAIALNDEGSLANEFMLVLQGKQGIGKTNFFRALAIYPEWFKEGACIDTDKKDTIIEATSTFITELGEFESTTKKEQPALKAFITAKFDEYRRPYAKAHERIERHTVFCATVNSLQFLRDTTGSRRFVVIPVDKINKDVLYSVMQNKEWIIQLYRQVYEQYYLTYGQTGYFLSDEEREYSEDINAYYFSCQLPAENELLDLLDWNLPTEFWNWYSPTDILQNKSDQLRRYTAKQIGEALRHLMTTDKRIEQRRMSRGIEYKIPISHQPKKSI